MSKIRAEQIGTPDGSFTTNIDDAVGGWSSDVTWNSGNIVNRNGTLYVCKTNDHVSVTPPEDDATNWKASSQFTADTVADMTAKSYPIGAKVSTQGYYTAGYGGQADYLVVDATAYGSTPDGYGDHYDAAGNVLVLQFSGAVNVRQFGAVGDGVADDTNAIQSAIDTAPPTGIKVHIPSGRYLISSITLGGNGGIDLVGDGATNTTILSSLATTDTVTLSGWYCTIKSMGFSSSISRTDGSFIKVEAQHCRIESFRINGDFIGIFTTGVATKILDGVFGTGEPGGTRILCSGGDTSQLIHNIIIGAQSAPYPAYGIRVLDSSALIISDTSVISAGIALGVEPGDGQSVYSMFVDNCFFDTSDIGIRFLTSGTGKILRCRVCNSWASSMSQNGVKITNGASGQIAGIDIDNMHCLLNTQAGMTIDGAVSDIKITNSLFAANGGGGIYADRVDGISITGCLIGNGYGESGNTGVGLTTSGNTSNLVLDNNRFTTNSAGNVSGLTAASPRTLGNNIGLTTKNEGAAVITSGLTSVIVSHELYGQPTHVSVTPEGDLGAASNYWVDGFSPTEFTINTNVDPGQTVWFRWSAAYR